MLEAAIVAAPNGRPTGAGTMEDPLDLATALSADSPATPGDTILLRGGTYEGAFTSELSGTSEAPILVGSYPGEWAILDGARERASTLTVRGSDTWVRDLEVMRSDPERATSESGSHPTTLSRGVGDGIAVFGPRTRLINLVVHDNGNGIGFWQPAVDSEVYGVLSFNNGWIAPDRPHGHGMYVQNTSGTKRVADSFFFNNFRFGVLGYGVNGRVVDIGFEGITSFDNGKPAGQPAVNLHVGASREPAHGISVERSAFYSTSGEFDNVRIGFRKEVQNDNAKIQGNAIVGGSPALSIYNWRELNVFGNLILARSDKTMGSHFMNEVWSPTWLLGEFSTVPAYDWDHNSYFEVAGAGSGSARRFLVDTEHEEREGRALTFEGWQRKSGLDTHSVATVGRPPGVDVRIEPNEYERGRAMITVLNWDEQRSIELDLSASGLAEGSAFEIRDVENYLGPPVSTGVYRGGSIELPMNTGRVTRPIGRPDLAHTSIEFGAFVLLPVGPS